jgi:hypothetical protein
MRLAVGPYLLPSDRASTTSVVLERMARTRRTDEKQRESLNQPEELWTWLRARASTDVGSGRRAWSGRSRDSCRAGRAGERVGQGGALAGRNAGEDLGRQRDPTLRALARRQPKYVERRDRETESDRSRQQRLDALARGAVFVRHRQAYVLQTLVLESRGRAEVDDIMEGMQGERLLDLGVRREKDVATRDGNGEEIEEAIHSETSDKGGLTSDGAGCHFSNVLETQDRERPREAMTVDE